MHSKISENEKSMQSLLDNGLLQQILVKSAVDTHIGNYLTELKVFGSVEILTKQERLLLRNRKNKQAQLLAVQKPLSIQDITLKRIKTLTSSNGGVIRGFCVTSDKHLLLTHYSESKLSLLDVHGSCLASIPMKYSDSYDVICLDNDNVLVTSGNSNYCGINIIHLPTRKRVKFIKLPGKPYSIASTGEMMFCVVENMGIYQINKKDYTISNFVRGNLPYQSFVAIYEDKIYFSNDTSFVICTNHSRETLWKLNYESILNQPRGATFDHNGNLYITGEYTCNVVVLTNDGKQHREILTSSDCLNYPSAIFFDRDKNRLIVSNGNEKLFVFKVS
ncbi:uncharacterized protein LOC127724719 [Mytilus californianus]|uniref:uncharacterized protein LOC127724719 n=1 Tax=Mytilus californianus TaxID=6549 RepID=UPI0022450B05|nr:uncharacterized protein LOC127724719 [Mytilus californianus]